MNHPDLEVRLNTTVEEIREHSIVLQKEGQFEELPVAQVVVATGMRNNNELAEALRSEWGPEDLYVVGDCHMPRMIKEAFEEAGVIHDCVHMFIDERPEQLPCPDDPP